MQAVQPIPEHGHGPTYSFLSDPFHTRIYSPVQTEVKMGWTLNRLLHAGDIAISTRLSCPYQSMKYILRS
jgi:hypothetical protein